MISIRNAKHAKTGLADMIAWIEAHSKRPFSQFRMVEIGCYVGDSTQIFAPKCMSIHCIDPWKNGYDNNDAASSQHSMAIVEAQFDEMCKQFNNIFKIKATGDEGARVLADMKFDFIYIDGLHTYGGVKNDIEKWLPLLADGGFIGGHDYNSKHFPGVKVAVDERFSIPDATFADSSWIIKYGGMA